MSEKCGSTKNPCDEKKTFKKIVKQVIKKTRIKKFCNEEKEKLNNLKNQEIYQKKNCR